MSAESIENLLGKTIVNSNGDEIVTSSLASKKQIILYFSAHWCPPCRGFTPLLSKAYEEYKQKVGDQAEVEVVFVSGDNDENSFKEYLRIINSGQSNKFGLNSSSKEKANAHCRSAISLIG